MFDLKKMNEALKDASSGSDTIVDTNTSTEIAPDKPKRTRKPKAQSTARHIMKHMETQQLHWRIL